MKMLGNVRCWLSPGWVWVAVAAMASFGLSSARSSQPPEPPAPADDSCEQPREKLTACAQALARRAPVIKQRMEAITKELEELEAHPDALPASDLAKRKDELIAERAALEGELKFLESAGTAWQAALDACESAARFKKETEQFQVDGQHRADEFVAGDLAALQSQLDQVQNARAALEEPETVRGERLTALTELLEKPDERAGQLLMAERDALRAESASSRHKRTALEAEQTLLEAKLAVARAVVGEVAAPPTETPTQAPAADEADALNKQRLAEELDAEARNRLEFTRARLDELESDLEQASAEDRETARLENEREYWKRVEGYEQRRLQQAELHKRSAREKEAIGQLRRRMDEARQGLEQLQAQCRKMAPEDRQKRADEYRAQAEASRAEADALDQQASAEEKEIEPLQQVLPGLEAVEQALYERLAKAATFSDAQRLSNHARRMRGQLDAERQLADLMVATTENVVYAKMRRATLTRELADLYVRCADVLVPPEASFWQRQRKIIYALGILLAVIGACYAVRFMIWLTRRALAVLNAISGRHFSVKRLGTLLSFAGSIVKLFIWVFGVVAVLNEFGIDPAKSTGAIGLIGLIMAGMFQQIVVDFVKGLDIIAGRHYNVGDFIEVDGKYGHVVDFNAKYTRLRTVSGQEFNIPNSRCVPSRRFPDGYVNNYVDIALKSPADQARARRAIDAFCPILNQRIEPIREVPSLAWRFAGPGEQITLRYRVRVLPGCSWVVEDHFIPAVKKALAEEGIELAAEPNLFYINRIETFRKLFSRRLSEEEIIREAAQVPPTPEVTPTDEGSD